VPPNEHEGQRIMYVSNLEEKKSERRFWGGEVGMAELASTAAGENGLRVEPCILSANIARESSRTILVSLFPNRDTLSVTKVC
jgi:hypothetical protein